MTAGKTSRGHARRALWVACACAAAPGAYTQPAAVPLLEGQPREATQTAEERFRYEVEIDTAGRIRLPDRLIQQLGLGNPVVILGARDHLELRGAAQWRVRLGEKMAKRDEIMLRARRSLAERPRGPRPDDAS